ncbi:MAG: hypothetical protein K0S27_744 [Gammaproteobacteria bacterium]|jgi:hypothetical protein|nr:hypothetical protein [Gammaproteobacteria bacterium]
MSKQEWVDLILNEYKFSDPQTAHNLLAEYWEHACAMEAESIYRPLSQSVGLTAGIGFSYYLGAGTSWSLMLAAGLGGAYVANMAPFTSTLNASLVKESIWIKNILKDLAARKNISGPEAECDQIVANNIESLRRRLSVLREKVWLQYGGYIAGGGIGKLAYTHNIGIQGTQDSLAASTVLCAATGGFIGNIAAERFFSRQAPEENKEERSTLRKRR